MTAPAAPAAAQEPGAPPPPMTGAAVRGLRWTSSGTVASVAVQLVYTAAVSRLLPPAAFGLVALGTVLLRFASYFAQLGLGSALVQKRELTDEDVRTAFTASVLLGTLVCAGFWLLAPVGAGLLGDPHLTGVVRALAFSFVLTGLGAPSVAILRRRLRFRAVAVCELASFGLGYLVVGLGLAYAGAGVWSLVFAALAQCGLLSAMAYAATRHAVAPLLDRGRLATLSSFGGRVSVIGFLEFWSGNADTLVVGRLLGAGALGLYNRASLLVVLPLHHLATSATKVLLPSFSRIQDDTDRVGRAYVGAFALLSAAILPVCAAIAAAAPEAVPILLGEQFRPVVGLVPYVAVATGLSMLTHLPAVVLEARGALNPKLVIQVVHLAGMVLALVVVSRRGPTLAGFAVAWSGAELLRHGLYLATMGRHLPHPRRRLARCYRQALGLSLVVVVAMIATGAALAGHGLAPAVVLAAKGVAGVLAYAVAAMVRPGLEVRREAGERHLLGLVLGLFGQGRAGVAPAETTASR